MQQLLRIRSTMTVNIFSLDLLSMESIRFREAMGIIPSLAIHVTSQE